MVRTCTPSSPVVLRSHWLFPLTNRDADVESHDVAAKASLACEEEVVSLDFLLTEDDSVSWLWPCALITNDLSGYRAMALCQTVGLLLRNLFIIAGTVPKLNWHLIVLSFQMLSLDIFLQCIGLRGPLKDCLHDDVSLILTTIRNSSINRNHVLQPHVSAYGLWKTRRFSWHIIICAIGW